MARATHGLPFLLLAGCLGPLSPVHPEQSGAHMPEDAGASVTFSVRDALGRSVDPLDAPLVPTVVATFVADPAPDTDALWLVRGTEAEVAAFAEDLARKPVRKATTDARVPVWATFQGNEVQVTPRSPLPRDVDLALVVTGWTSLGDDTTVNAPVVFAMHTSRRPNAGATLIDTWPPAGALNVPRNLAAVMLHFDGDVSQVEGRVSLQREVAPKLTADVAAYVMRTPCGEVGWDGGTCVVVTPKMWLTARTPYQWSLARGALDGSGAELPSYEGHFETSSATDDAPPTPTPMPCGPDEETVSVGCLRADDTGADLRVAFAEPVLLALRWGQKGQWLTADRGAGRFVVHGLTPDSTVDATLEATDLAGHRTMFALPIRTSSPLPTVTITEVLADPRGPEPTQEYVEVWNFGDEAVNLRDFSLSDGDEDGGDVLDRDAWLAPHTAALITAANFDPAAPDDVPVPSGVPIVPVDDALGRGGLTNGGEAVFLRDPEGRRLSGVPALPSPGPGACLVRNDVQTRDDSPASFHFVDADHCTPGTVTSYP